MSDLKLYQGGCYSKQPAPDLLEAAKRLLHEAYLQHEPDDTEEHHSIVADVKLVCNFVIAALQGDVQVAKDEFIEAYRKWNKLISNSYETPCDADGVSEVMASLGEVKKTWNRLTTLEQARGEI